MDRRSRLFSFRENCDASHWAFFEEDHYQVVGECKFVFQPKNLNLSRETRIVFALNTLNSLGWSATMPFLAAYLVTARSVPLSIVGVTYLASGFLVLLGQLISGRLTDSIGPKRVMLFSYSCSLASALLLGRLIQIQAAVEWILVLYPIFSFLRTMSQPATSAIVANQKESELRTSFSVLSIGGNLGFAIGPAIGGILSQFYGYSTVFLLSAATAAIVGVIVFIEIEGGPLVKAAGNLNSYPKLRRRLDWKEDKAIILFLALVLLSFLAVGYEITPLSVYVVDFMSFSPAELGYLFATNGAVIVILQLPISKMTERAKHLVTPMILSSIFASLAFFGAALAGNFADMELVMVMVTLGEILQTVPSQTVLTLFSRSWNRGTYQGYYNGATSSGRSLAAFIGPLSFGLLAFSPMLGWVLIAVFSLVVGFGFFLMSPSLEREYHRRESNKDGELMTWDYLQAHAEENI
jgi:predicted MFS family arabinose efflux permease